MDFQLLRQKLKKNKVEPSPETSPQTPQSPVPEEIPSSGADTSHQPDVSQQPASASEILEFLWIRLMGEDYLIPLADVDEVVRVLPMTVVPKVPSWVLGVMSLRGEMIPVVDLRRKLGFPDGPREGRIVVCFSGIDRCGFLVDEVRGVIRVGKDACQEVGFGSEEKEVYLKGLVRFDHHLFGELDLRKVLENHG
jgi:purine-binding chemotaxis protein CheW